MTNICRVFLTFNRKRAGFIILGLQMGFFTQSDSDVLSLCFLFEICEAKILVEVM